VTAVVQNLLALYVGLLLINVALSATLWWKNRDPLYRALFFVWLTTAFSFVLQGALAEGDLAISLGFASVFPVNLAIAHLGSLATGVSLAWRRFVGILVLAVVASIVLHFAGLGFTAVALPIAIAVALPSLVTALRIIATRWRSLSISGRALAVSSILFSAHNLDFAFLRDRPDFAPLGFTIAILIIFALSITGPAVVLELVTERQSRIATEMDAARRIQAKIVPRDAGLPGLEIVTYLRPADEVGGDYLDLYSFGEDSWLLLGDVTGHGLGAGLVMLMAQSTISSILQTRPDIAPRELNWLANRVLHANLRRLEESRHMTVVSLRRRSGNHFTLSGAHDDIFIVRADGKVERRSVNHFPLGLGFLEGLTLEDVAEESFELAEGDLLFVGTDGISEASPGGDPRRGMFGDEAVTALLAEHVRAPVREIQRALIAKLDAFTGGVYHDDVAFLLVRARGAEA
jgi:serine phosphatase RsbU (regulator of sigma subunit)